MTPELHRCERGKRCHARERDGDTPVGAVCDRPLCDLCERSVARVLLEAPWVYRDLRAHTLIHATVERGPQVSISRGSPMPLNAGALHLAEDLWWLLCAWEDVVRGIARLTPARRRGKREGRQVTEAARLLEAHLTAWIGAPVTGFIAHTGHDPHTDAAVEQSGVQAACALLDWRAQVRNLPGLDTQAPKAVRRLHDYRCPDCGIQGAVTHHAGDDLMQCQNCGGTRDYMPAHPGLPAGADVERFSA